MALRTSVHDQEVPVIAPGEACGAMTGPSTACVSPMSNGANTKREESPGEKCHRPLARCLSHS
jgi:hypothetical protein